MLINCRIGISVLRRCIARNCFILLLAIICIVTPSFATLDHKLDGDDEVTTKSIMKSVELLQRQQGATLQAIDRATQQNETTSKQNAVVLNAFLDHIEQVINIQNKRNEANLQMSHRLAVIVSIICVFSVICILAWTLIILRTIHRRFPAAPIQSLLPPAGEFIGTPPGSGQRSQLTDSNPVDKETEQFEKAVALMEDRIENLESLSTTDKQITANRDDTNQSISQPSHGNGSATAKAVQPKKTKKSANHNKQRPTGVDLKQVKTIGRILR